MTRKIIRLESLSLMNYFESPNDGTIIQDTKDVEIGHPYDDDWYKYDSMAARLTEVHSDRDVVKIEYARNAVYGNPGAYVVTLKNGNEVRLPECAFACEDTEVGDDGY